MGNSPIEWTEQTWNPVVGCSIVSPGCTNCYAMNIAYRFKDTYVGREWAGKSAENVARSVNGKAVWTGQLALAPDHIFLAPQKRKKPTTYFVNSMGDLFHEDCPDEWIDKVFAVMALCPQHTFQVLTKRAGRMRDYFAQRSGNISPTGFRCPRISHILNHADRISRHDYPAAFGQLAAKVSSIVDNGYFPNVWLGVSTERQQEADERIPPLLQTPAAVRFISAEPLLGHIALHALNLGTRSPSNALRGVQCVPDDSSDGYHNEKINKLDWVIVGGESGPGARPMHPDWASSIRDHCQASGVPFFFKQWGEWRNGSDFADDAMCVTTDGRVMEPTPDALYAADREAALMNLKPTLMRRVGKKAAGRHLDGVLHDAMPRSAAREGLI